MDTTTFAYKKYTQTIEKHYINNTRQLLIKKKHKRLENIQKTHGYNSLSLIIEKIWILH